MDGPIYRSTYPSNVKNVTAGLVVSFEAAQSTEVAVSYILNLVLETSLVSQIEALMLTCQCFKESERKKVFFWTKMVLIFCTPGSCSLNVKNGKKLKD